MKQLYQKSALLLFSLLSICLYAKGQVVANDDDAITGPLKKVRVDVTRNDNFICTHHTLSVVDISPPSAGTAEFDGDFLVFTPALGVIDLQVQVTYELTCPGIGSDQAVVAIYIREYNLPINIVDTDDYCIDEMPENVAFGIQQKFIAYPSTSGYLQQFHIPLVGDLNGDGKPEIIVPSLDDLGTLSASISNIFIFDGQTGSISFNYSIKDALGSDYGQFKIGNEPWHHSPSYLAIADFDRDGIGEIIVCESEGDGRVYSLKPTLDANKKITGLDKVWDADYGHKAPLSGNYQIFGHPMPNIVDINGDGIPEIVVYNKIYNGQTGKLIMAWNGEAVTPATSTLAENTGLYFYQKSGLMQNATYANEVKSRAMVGRRPAGTVLRADAFFAVPAIIDIDGDGNMEIITGNRIHKFSLTYLGKEGETGDHTQNTYTTVEGPESVTLPTNAAGTTTRTHYLNDGFTRVADIDGDGKLDIVVLNNLSDGYDNIDMLVYVYDPETGTLKAASSLYSNGHYGQFGIPFIGDINDRLDGRDIQDGAFTKKLPEILFCAGRISRNRTDSRSGMQYHPESRGISGNVYPSDAYHIIGITYDGGEVNIEDRLKISWVLAHNDQSNNTGITMFDFNNDGAFDLCYRDERRLRVISPKLGSSDHIPVSADETDPAILFKTEVRSETGFEAPAIADVNLDGSADIVVAGYSSGGYRANTYVFEHNPGSPQWAPCPPVWNQALYNPLYINEDLTVPAKPISMLTEFTDGSGETIRPYNGAWIQQPIVRYNKDYVPIYRHPDIVLVSMQVEQAGADAKVILTIRNDGLASMNSTTPIHFYMTTTPGAKVKSNEVVIPVGVDIFPNEKVTLEYTVIGDPAGMFIHCRLVDDGSDFPAIGYTDCNTTNNYGYTAIIKAVDDSYTAYTGNNNIFDITANDITIGNPILEIIEEPKKGTASITSEGKLSYTPGTSSSDKDVLRYTLKCEYDGTMLATIDEAYVYFDLVTLPTPTITGTEEVCCNQIEIYSTETGMSTYSWTVTDGTIIEGGGTYSIKVQWTGTAGSLSLNVTNSSGFSSATPAKKNIIIHPLPAPTITGKDAVCYNEIAVYSTEAGMSTYSWTVTGGTITEGDGTNSIKVQWTGTSGNLSLSVTNSNQCSSATPATKGITIHPLPAPTITGKDAVCYNEVAVYSTEAGMSTYRWTVTGGTITEGDGTNSIKVQWAGTSGNLSLSVTNSNLCSSATPATKGITIHPLPAPTITGKDAVCYNEVAVYSTEAGMSTYRWTVTGGTITEGDGTNSIKVQWAGTSGNLSLSVTNSNQCSSATPATKGITIHPLPAPTITGKDAVCYNEVAVYSTEAGMSTYRWTVTGGTITEGDGTNSIKVQWTGTSGDLSLSVTNSNQCSSATPATKGITIHPLPAPTITGKDAVCYNEVAVYTTEAGMNTYRWTVTGGTITEGDGTHSIKVQWAGTSGNLSLSVTNSNQCSSATPAEKSVVIHALSSPTISGTSTVWSNSTETYTTELSMNNYIWEVNGGTIQLGQGSNSVTVVWGAGPLGSLKVSYDNSNGCKSTSADFNITIQTVGFNISASSTNILEGGKAETINVCLAPGTYAPSGGILVSLITDAGTVANNSDYVLSGDVSDSKFPATTTIFEGERCTSFDINAILDDWIEGPEALVVKASTAGFPDSKINLTIIDRTVGDIIIRSMNNEVQEESGSTVKFWIGFKEDVKATKQVKITYKAGGSAKEGVDYESLPGYVIIPIGERGAEVDIIPKSNFIVQGNRVIELVLTNAETL